MFDFILLEEKPKENYLHFLYKILEEREYNISHSAMPSFDKHRSFVFNHPYKKWYLIKNEESLIGSLYIGFDNSVGINLLKKHLNLRCDIISIFLKTFSPSEGKASLIRNEFIFNISVKDKKFKDDLEKCGAIPIQTTYVFPKD